MIASLTELREAKALLAEAKDQLNRQGIPCRQDMPTGIMIEVPSAALMADAWHHRSDALSSVGSLVGIAGAQLGLPILDPIASLVICLFILKASYDIFMSAVRQLVDQSADPEVESAMAKTIRSQEGVLRLDLLRTRQFGSRLYVDVEIAADGNQTLFAAHAIAEQVHNQIEAQFPTVKHCMVHVNPIAKA